MGFEQNQGQSDKDVLYLARAAGYWVYLSRDALLVVFDSQDRANAKPVVRIRLANANQSVEPQGTDLLPGVTNYYIGNDPAKWRTGVRQFQRVRYHDVYPGVDLMFYGNRRQLEFDFDIAPGADPSRPVLKIDGATLRNSIGRLELTTPAGRKAVLKRPELYQMIGRSRRAVAGAYSLHAGNEVAFNVGRYDRRKPLVIDPALIYSTLVGASLDMTPFAIATDSSGAAYVTGEVSTGSTFVLKLDPSGSSMVYRTLLGGTTTGLGPVGDETVAAGQEIAVDANGNAYFAGTTKQPDFPTTSGVFGTSNFCANKSGAVSCFEPFAAKLDSTGKLVFSTFLAQSSTIDSAGPVPSSIAVDSNGALYVTGTVAKQNGGTFGPLSVAGLTTAPGSFQTTRKSDSSAFILKLHPDGSALDYSTYLGGSAGETPGGIAVDSSGIAYVDGGTLSADFPVTSGASLTTNPGTAAFFTKLKADGSGLLDSTFVTAPNGQSEGTSIAVDSSLAAYLAGMTAASFPQRSFGNASMPAFAAKFDASGNLVYSNLAGTQITYGFDLFFGTPPQSSIAVDGTGAVYVATASGGFSQSSISETKLDSSGKAVYTIAVGPIGPTNSRFGGVALDNKQSFYVAGLSGSLEDPVIPPGGVPIAIPDIGTTVGALEMLPPGSDPADPEEIMFVQKFVQSLGTAVPAPNPRAITFLPALQKGTTSSPRTITLFNYGDSNLAISGISIGGTDASDFAILNNSANTCGSTVSVQSSCSFQVTFTPTVSVGTRTATVNLSFGGGLAAQSIALSGTAGVPAFQASPNPVDFGNVAVGATSSIINVTISNPGTAPMNLLATPVFQGTNAADFGTCVLVTGHCGGPFVWPASVPAGGSFTAPLVFKPTATGARSAQLAFSTDVPGSPQMVQLQGIGASLVIGAGTGGNSATVAAGQTAFYSLTVTTSSSMSGAITVSCTGAPAGASCNPSPSTFSLGTLGSQAVAVNVPTTARTSASLNAPHLWLWRSLAAAVAIAFVRPRKRRGREMLFATAMILLLTAMVSCGGGSSGGGGGGGGGTPAGTYTLTVTATANSASSSLSLTLNVQ